MIQGYASPEDLREWLEQSEGHPVERLDHLSSSAGICGCADDSAAHLVAAILDVCDRGEHDHSVNKYEEFQKLIPQESAMYVVLSMLDDQEFIEHGTAIRYPWLTYKGRYWLAEWRKAIAEQADA